jgi:hypothetical protein
MPTKLVIEHYKKRIIDHSYLLDTDFTYDELRFITEGPALHMQEHYVKKLEQKATLNYKDYLRIERQRHI